MSRSKECPKCNAEIGDSYEPDDPSVGIVGGWYCDACELAVGEEYDDMDSYGTIPVVTGRPIGTPLSQLSGQPGQPGYSEFVRIAKSYGYD